MDKNRHSQPVVLDAEDIADIESLKIKFSHACRRELGTDEVIDVCLKAFAQCKETKS